MSFIMWFVTFVVYHRGSIYGCQQMIQVSIWFAHSNRIMSTDWQNTHVWTVLQRNVWNCTFFLFLPPSWRLTHSAAAVLHRLLFFCHTHFLDPLISQTWQGDVRRTSFGSDRRLFAQRGYRCSCVLLPAAVGSSMWPCAACHTRKGRCVTDEADKWDLKGSTVRVGVCVCVWKEGVSFVPSPAVCVHRGLMSKQEEVSDGLGTHL